MDSQKVGEKLLYRELLQLVNKATIAPENHHLVMNFKPHQQLLPSEKKEATCVVLREDVTVPIE